MRVLFVTGIDLAVLPNHRANHMRTYLENSDMQVDSIALIPYYTGPWPANFWTRFWHGFQDLFRHPVSVIEGNNGIKVEIRILPNRLGFFVHCLWAYLHLKPLSGKYYDVCIFGNPDIVLLPLLLKMRGRVRNIIYDDWDFYPGFDKSWFHKQLTKFREHLCVSRADLVISVGSLLKELRFRQGARRTMEIPNGVIYQLFALAQNKRPHPPTLIYTGRLDDDWGVNLSIQGFALVHQSIKDARYLIIGYNEGKYLQYLQQLVNSLGLSDSIFFIGPQKYEELPYYLAESDIGVIMHKPNELRQYAFPLKVVEYMAAGLSIVGTEGGESGKLITESKAGRCVPFSPDAFASAVMELFNDRDALNYHSKNAQNYAKRYDWGTLFSDLPGIIENTVSHSS